MYRPFIKKFLIAVIVTLPTLSTAADVAAPGDPKAAAPAKTSIPPVTLTDSKKAETTAIRQPDRIGHVDVARIGAESDRGKAIRAILLSKKDQLQGKIDGKKKQIEKLKESIESKIAKMTPQQREAKSKEFQKKLEEYQKFAQASEEEFFKLQENETRDLYEAIERSAVAYGKANGFAVIAARKELLYVGSAVDAQDVTEALIKTLNEVAQKK